AVGRDHLRRPVPELRSHRGGAVLVPALRAGGRALGALRAAPRGRGRRRAGGGDGPRDAAGLRGRLRVDRLAAALPRAPLDRHLRRLSHRPRADRDRAGRHERHQLATRRFVQTAQGFGATTVPVTIGKDHPANATSVVAGLLKGATYHARLVARNSAGLSLGADVSFALAAPNPPPKAPTPPPAPGPGAGRGPGPDQDSAPGKGKPSPPVVAPPAPPELGQTLGAAPQAGNVLVRLPGSAHAVALNDAASIPVGSILDARKGTVTLSTALPGEIGRAHV